MQFQSGWFTSVFINQYLKSLACLKQIGLCENNPHINCKSFGVDEQDVWETEHVWNKWEKVSTVEVTPETNVSACFTQPALANVALGNSCYLTAFLETISPGYPYLKMGTEKQLIQ